MALPNEADPTAYDPDLDGATPAPAAEPAQSPELEFGDDPEPNNLVPTEPVPAPGVTVQSVETLTAQLTAATAQLERQGEEIGMMRTFMAQTANQPQPPAAQPQPQQDNGQQFTQADADLMLTNPQEFLNTVVMPLINAGAVNNLQAVEQQVNNRIGAAQSQADLKNAFFEANPDLKSVPFLVQEAARVVGAKYGNTLTPDAALPHVAQEARNMINTIKQAQAAPVPTPTPSAGGGPGTPAPILSVNQKAFQNTMDFANRVE